MTSDSILPKSKAAYEMKARYWVFTLNNPVAVNQPEIWFKEGKVTYVTWQHEVGESGTPHLQGYVDCGKQQSLNYMRKQVCQAHWEQRRGTHVC